MHGPCPTCGRLICFASLCRKGSSGARGVGPIFREYAESLGVDLSFQGFDRELATLPGDYAPPSGQLLLAALDGSNGSLTKADAGPTCRSTSTSFACPASSAAITSLGCIGLRKFADGICEMKRLYVRPEFRRHGVGRAPADGIIQGVRNRPFPRAPIPCRK